MNQHNIFTWMLDGPRFAMLPELDSTSRMIESTMNDFLRNSTPEKRKMLVETLFTALNATNAHTLEDMADHWTDTAGALWDAIKKLDGATLRTVTSVLGSLATSGVESARRFLSYGDAPNGAFASGPGKTAVVKQTNDTAAVTDQPVAQDNPSVSGGMQSFCPEAWQADMQRVFGASAPALIAAEQTCWHQNDVTAHAFVCVWVWRKSGSAEKCAPERIKPVRAGRNHACFRKSAVYGQRAVPYPRQGLCRRYGRASGCAGGFGN